jgi:hypothetical protein
MTPSITQDQINTAVGDFIELVTGVPCVVGQVNRVPELAGDFAVMWPLYRPRLSTNLETPADSRFTASIAGTTMTVTAVDPNAALNSPIAAGRNVYGAGVADNTRVVAPGTGTGGVGTYTVSVSQAVSSETMSAGSMLVETDAELVVQVDLHGPNSADAAVVLQSLFRDGYAADQLEPLASPLYADEPRQLAFVTAAKEYENRWSVDLHMQVNTTVLTPQQFADAVVLTVKDVDVAFPPQ